MLGPDSLNEIIGCCEACSQEIAHCLGQALDQQVDVTLSLASTWDPRQPPEGYDGPGLVVALNTEQGALIAALPESYGIVPAWCRAPDAAAQSRLEILAQSLAMLMVPSNITVLQSRAAWVPCLSAAIAAGSPAPASPRLPLSLRWGTDRRGTLSLIWPLARPERIYDRPETVNLSVRSKTGGRRLKLPPGELPNYTKSLLRIKVPVGVTLARKRQPVAQILELGIGSIIHFDKSCDDLLEVEVNGHKVAVGEAVKVGEKFGLRVQAVVLPPERFKSFGPAE